MIACPHCQFKNPTLNRFCQRCGNPLRNLRAIITRPDEPLGQSERPNIEPISTQLTRATAPTNEAEGSLPSLNGMTLATLLTADKYLDREQRYQLRLPIETSQPLPSELELDVIDCQPGAESPVSMLSDVEAPSPLVLPLQAYPYWKLQEQFFPVIPELQAAWQAKRCTVLILEDRSAWRSLSEVWHSEAAEPLELIHWLYEMADLWDSLAAFEAEPSLLSNPNLLIDDDQILCLKRLLYRPSDRTYDIKDLGLLWQSLLQKSTDTRFVSIEDLALDVAGGVVTQVSDIKNRLASIADSIQGEAAAEILDAAEAVDPAAEIEMSATVPPGAMPLPQMTMPPLLEEDLLLDEMLDDDVIEEAEAADDGIGDLPTMALPMKLYQLDEAGRTHVGRQRTHNEDFFYTETDVRRVDSPSESSLCGRGLYILCDGMGGHAGGEVASALAVETLRDYFESCWEDELPDEETIRQGILKANQIIFEANEAEARAGNARMGTTLVMLLLADNQASVAHVGDSRLYGLTRQGLKQLTVDHEVGQREINRGVEPAIAYARPDAYQLTQALGPREGSDLKPSISTLYVNQDTLFMLCSDGLSDNDLVEEHAATHLEPLLRSHSNLEEGVAKLIELANDHNGHDNITAIAIRLKMRPNLEAIKDARAAMAQAAQEKGEEAQEKGEGVRE